MIGIYDFGNKNSKIMQLLRREKWTKRRTLTDMKSSLVTDD